MSETVDLLRHALATLAYRGGKAVRGAPDAFGAFHLAATSRTPVQILAHIGDLLDWGLRIANGDWKWTAASIGEWDAEVDRFFAALARLDERLASGEALGHPAGKIFQGPIADALTHVGQLSMVRGIAGAPVRPESYGRAAIRAGQVGRDQPAAKAEYDGDASARR